jgi:predicted aspartyl protease
MGTFTVGCLIKNQVDREKAVQIPRLMVDTGSEATWIPRNLLEQIGVKPEKRQTFQMANGQWVYRDVGYALVRVGQRETTDEIVFAEKGDYVLLGARALEGLLLWVDPKNKKLIEIAAHPVAKVVVPGKVSPGKDQPLVTGMVIQGQGGPPPVVGETPPKSAGRKLKRNSRQSSPHIRN